MPFEQNQLGLSAGRTITTHRRIAQIHGSPAAAAVLPRLLQPAGTTGALRMLSCRATRRGATWNVSATESIFASIISMRRIIPSSNCHSQQSDNLPRLPPALARAPTEPQG